MTAFSSIHVALLFASAFICLALACRVGFATRGRGTGGRFFYVLVASVFWPLTSALSAVSPNEEWAARLFMLHYAAIGFTAVFMLRFTLRYVDPVRPFPPPSLLLFAVPLLVTFAVLIEPQSFFSALIFVHAGPFFLVDTYEPHWLFWLNSFLAYVLLGTSYCLMFAAIFRSRALYAAQTLLLVAGATLLFGVNILTRGDLLALRLPHLDWTGAALSAACVLWYIAVFNYRFLDVMPLARDVLVETMRDAVLVLDPLGRAVDANPAMRAFLNKPLSSIVGEPMESILPPEVLRRITSGGEHELNEEVEISVAGSARQFDLRVSRLGDETGETIGRLVVLQDVTERARMIRDLDAYARVVAHDLKNPISVIAGYADLLSEHAPSLTELAREDIQGIRSTSRRMARIVNELLLMSGPRGERAQFEELNMRELVAEAQRRLTPMIAATGAEIAVGQSWPVAIGQPAWVEEVWENYLSNAIKYGGQPPKIEIGAERLENGMARFFVRDNGAGFDDEQRARLFQEFQRLHPDRGEGHGLGLSIARRLVERLGGKVGAESIPGKGSTFWFELPVRTKPGEP